MSMRKAVRAALAIAASLAAVTCGGSGGSPPTGPTGGGGGGSSATVTVTITGQGGRSAFAPNPAAVTAGQLVVFKNNDSVIHHIILDDGTVQTADIPPGATSAAVAMGTSGSPTYHCTIHPGMIGGFNGSEPEPPPNCNQAYCGG
jgi:plastocyanin